MIAECHDALVMECPDSEIHNVVEIGKKAFEEPIDFSICSLPREQLIIPCDIKVGKNWRDLEKYKMEEICK